MLCGYINGRFNRRLIIPDSVNNCGSMLSEQNRFNSEICIGAQVKDCHSMFWGCGNLDKPIIIPPDAETCGAMFLGCNNFNSRVTMPETDGCQCGSMFADCPNFNQNVYVPDNAYCRDILRGCTNYRSTLSIPSGSPSTVRLTARESTNGATIIDRSTGTAYRVEQHSGNGQWYWNDGSGGSYYGPNDNDPVVIPDDYSSTASYFKDYYRYNQPTSIPNSSASCKYMFSGCTSFNSEVTFKD